MRGYLTRKYMRLDRRRTQSASMKYFTKDEAGETIGQCKLIFIDKYSSTEYKAGEGEERTLHLLVGSDI